MRCKPLAFCYNCNCDILYIDYEEYQATEIMLDKKWVDMCGCCYNKLVQDHVSNCLNDLIYNLINDTSFCEQKCCTNSSFL